MVTTRRLRVTRLGPPRYYSSTTNGTCSDLAALFFGVFSSGVVLGGSGHICNCAPDLWGLCLHAQAWEF